MNKHYLENLLHTLFLLLGLAFIGLIFVSLAYANSPEQQSGPISGGAQTNSSVVLSKSFDREEIAMRVQAKLIEKIRKELVTLPDYDVFDNLNFSIDQNDVVTLHGQVRLPSLKKSAERVVNNIEGVTSVVNQLEVLPTSSFDDDIRRAAFITIYSQSQLNRYVLSAVPSIHIIVKNGKLTLEGVVANETDKSIAGIRAHEVPNVFEIVNNLRVENRQ